MNKFKLLIATAIAILIIVFQTGCESTSENQTDAEGNINEANQDLQDGNNDNNTITLRESEVHDWVAFKAESEAKIADNKAQIQDLRNKMTQSGKTMDAVYENKIESLEKQNDELQVKLDNYEKEQGNWETFKREFNHDMDELGKALKDITVDNRN